MEFLARWLITAIAVGAATWIVPGIEIFGSSAWVAIFIMALFLSAINASIKPILQLLSLPISILTFGIFALILNTGMLYLASWLANGIFQIGFSISSFGAAFVASIVISIVSSLVNFFTGN